MGETVLGNWAGVVTVRPGGWLSELYLTRNSLSKAEQVTSQDSVSLLTHKSACADYNLVISYSSFPILSSVYPSSLLCQALLLLHVQDPG